MKLTLKISNTARRGGKVIELRTDKMTTNQKPGFTHGRLDFYILLPSFPRMLPSPSGGESMFD